MKDVGSGWVAAWAPQDLLTVLCPQDGSSFMSQGHFSKMLSDTVPRLPLLAALRRMCSEGHPSTPIPTLEQPGEGPLPEGPPEPGRRSRLDPPTSFPMHWQELLRVAAIPYSIPNFPARLEAFASPCLIVKHQRKQIISAQHLNNSTEIPTQQYAQVFYSTAVVALTWGEVCRVG